MFFLNISLDIEAIAKILNPYRTTVVPIDDAIDVVEAAIEASVEAVGPLGSIESGGPLEKVSQVSK